jgi:hypothetical protein
LTISLLLVVAQGVRFRVVLVVGVVVLVVIERERDIQ